ncbi:MAG: TatD family hydrolase [Chitinophagaceae bacterium]
MYSQILLDTHCHLYDESFHSDIDEMIQRGLDAGVYKMLLPNIDKDSIAPMISLSDRYPDHCFPMMGLHPCYVKDDYREHLVILEQWLGQKTFIGIGEIGLDYYWDKTFKEQQLDAFRIQLKWALEKELPVSIHSRESFHDCLDIVREIGNGRIKGVFHCFGGTARQARDVMDIGMFIGIGGVVTYKKSDLGSVLKEIGLKNVVLETDAPYLPPVPYRGKRNESSYLTFIAEKIAEEVGISFADVATITSENASKVFITTV